MKWVDKDGVEYFSDYKIDIPPETPFEAQDEILFDPAADAAREKQDKQTMEVVNKEESEMLSETKKEDQSVNRSDLMKIHAIEIRECQNAKK